MYVYEASIYPMGRRARVPIACGDRLDPPHYTHWHDGCLLAGRYRSVCMGDPEIFIAKKRSPEKITILMILYDARAIAPGIQHF